MNKTIIANTPNLVELVEVVRCSKCKERLIAEDKQFLTV